MDLSEIIKCLAANRQRATYGAVANLLGTSPRGLMRDRPMTKENSWVVSQKKKLPTGYEEKDMAPGVRAKEGVVISDAETLRSWLKARAVR
jgi:hypothetical protein